MGNLIDFGLSDDAKAIYGGAIECALMLDDEAALVIDPVMTTPTVRFHAALNELVAKGYLSESTNDKGCVVYRGLQSGTGLGEWVLDNKDKADWPLFERQDWQEDDRWLN